MLEIILLLILTHLVADFPLQTNKLNKMKKRREFSSQLRSMQERTIRKRIGGIALHVLIHFSCTVLVVGLYALFYLEGNFDYTALLQLAGWSAVLHFGIDYTKEHFHDNKKIKPVVFYLLDQGLHLLTLIILAKFFGFLEIQVLDIEKLFNYLISEESLNISFVSRIAMIGIILILNTYFSGYLIGMLVTKGENKSGDTKKIYTLYYDVDSIGSIENYSKGDLIEKLKSLNMKSEGMTVEETISEVEYKDTEIKYGKYIGYLERLIIMVLVAVNAISAIAFVIGIKALARFKQFEDRDFAEYYLIGTMISILMGLLSGWLLLRVIS